MVGARHRGKLLERKHLDLHELRQRFEAVTPIQEIPSRSIRVEQERHLLLARHKRNVVRFQERADAVADEEVREFLTPHQADQRHAQFHMRLP